MTRDALWLAVNERGEVRLQRGGDAGVQLLPLAAQQRAVGSILHQRVFEGVDRLGRDPAAKDQFGFDQLLQGPLDICLWEGQG